MDTTIYDKIEKEIKKTDYYMRDNFITNIFSLIVCFLIPTNVWIIILFSYIGWIILAAEIIIFVLTVKIANFKLVYEIFQLSSSNCKNELKELKRSDFFNPKKTKKATRIVKEQKPLILDIIKKYGITTNNGLEEAIAHYRFKASESKLLPINFLTLFALAISIVSFFINDDNIYGSMSKAILIMIIVLAFGLYMIVLYYYRVFFAKFSKKAFYTRIESQLSEIRAMNKLSSNEEDVKSEEILDI